MLPERLLGPIVAGSNAVLINNDVIGAPFIDCKIMVGKSSGAALHQTPQECFKSQRSTLTSQQHAEVNHSDCIHITVVFSVGHEPTDNLFETKLK